MYAHKDRYTRKRLRDEQLKKEIDRELLMWADAGFKEEQKEMEAYESIGMTPASARQLARSEDEPWENRMDEIERCDRRSAHWVDE